MAPNSPDLQELFASILESWGMEKIPGKLASEKMRELILRLCQDRWLSLNTLSSLLERDNKALQDQYLTPMLAEEILRLKFPDTKNHPAQAYMAKS